MEELQQALVLDFGSYHSKFGIAGDDAPRGSFPTCVGRARNKLSTMDTMMKAEYVGSDAISKRGILTLHYPIERGAVTNYDLLQKVYKHCFENELRVDPMDSPILIADSPASTVEDRAKMMEIMFESFGVPALNFSMQGVLALYGSGLTSGTVLDSGAALTYTLPVLDGVPLREGIETMAIGGRDLSHLLYSFLVDLGYQSCTAAERPIAGKIKKNLCFVAQDYEKELLEPKTKEFELPDGTMLSLSNQLFKVPEVMFQPQISENGNKGVHECIVNSVRKCDIEKRKELFKNIVISGGNTLFPGFTERLSMELSKLIPSNVDFKVVDPSFRMYSAWVGGSVIASMSTFSQVLVDRSGYKVEWTTDTTNNTLTARFTLPNSAGWAGIGLKDESTGMAGATILITSVDQIVGEFYASLNSPPESIAGGGSPFYTLASSSLNESTTTINLVRSLTRPKMAPSTYYEIIQGNTMKLLMAAHSSDPYQSYHDSNFAFVVDFFTSSACVQPQTSSKVIPTANSTKIATSVRANDSPQNTMVREALIGISLFFALFTTIIML